jgi:hypothetical protein
MIHRGRREYAELLATAFDGVEAPGARHMIALDIKLVQTSCGLGVPLFDFVDERRGPATRPGWMGAIEGRRPAQEAPASEKCPQHRWLAHRFD